MFNDTSKTPKITWFILVLHWAIDVIEVIYYIIIIIVNLYSAFFVKNPKRAACASLVEREEKGFEVVLKR